MQSAIIGQGAQTLQESVGSGDAASLKKKEGDFSRGNRPPAINDKAQLLPRGSPLWPPWPSFVPSGSVISISVPPRVPSLSGWISTATLSPGFTVSLVQPMRVCWPVEASSIDHCRG